MNMGQGGFNGLGNQPQGDDMSDEELMEELMQAMQAGDNAEMEGDSAEVPGAEESQSGENQMDPEKLKELLLQAHGGGNNGGSSNMGGSGGMSGGKF